MDRKSPIFEVTYRNYLKQLETIDLSQRADVLGAAVSNDVLQIPFYGKTYQVSTAGVFDGQGQRANFAVSVLLCCYVLQSPAQMPQNGAWVTYREFKDAGPLVGYFATNTNRLIETTFSGRLAALQKVARSLGGEPSQSENAYDLTLQFQVLPRIPLMLRFNDQDDEFPAQCTILFRQSAESYLDMESLAIAGTFLAGFLIAQ